MGTVLRERSCHFGSAIACAAGSAIRMIFSDNMPDVAEQLKRRVLLKWVHNSKGGREEEEQEQQAILHQVIVL